ncbi:hypothetical protein [Streptomyces sp. NPDC056938]|uniref:hypothetical protein n=1 Tax=unclassified Streptomyces TaxID=2593676 RepID=UPI00362BDC49
MIGGSSYPIGGRMLATAADLLCSGLLCIRFGFRRTLAAGEATPTWSARHGK